jgi:hypothetical protein
MNTKTLMVLGGITVLVAGVAAVTMQSREAAVKGASDSRELFPDLIHTVNDVSTISIKKKDGECVLKKNGDAWGLVQKNGYRVDLEPVRKTLIGLTEATLVEEKTSDKGRYAQIGVQDPDAEGSTSTLVTLEDSSGKVLASLIVGKTHEGKNFGSNEVYVRRAGEAPSWLVKASLDLKDKAVDWLDKKILEIKRDRIRSVDVKHPDGEVVHVEREKPEDTNFTLSNIPAGKELTFPTAASGMASSLEWLNLEDVVPASAVDFTANPGPVCRFTTFDGLTITVTTKDDKDKTYARFVASYEAPPDTVGPKPDEKKDAAADATAEKGDKKDDKKPEKKTPEEVQKEVVELNARLGPWVYIIPTYNKATFTKHMADLVKDKAPPAPPPGSTPEKKPDGSAAAPGGQASDTDTYKIPGDIPPEIQEQIKADLASRGHKSEVVPAQPVETKPAEAKPGDAKPDEKKSDAKPADEAKPSDPKPPGDTPKDSTKPPQR